MLFFCPFFTCSHSACFHLLCSEQADKHTRKETTETRRKTAQEQNTNGKLAEYDHVKKRQKKSGEAASFKHMKIKYPIHLKMAMQ
jgi:hypothetical protein